MVIFNTFCIFNHSKTDEHIHPKDHITPPHTEQLR